MDDRFDFEEDTKPEHPISSLPPRPNLENPELLKEISRLNEVCKSKDKFIVELLSQKKALLEALRNKAKELRQLREVQPVVGILGDFLPSDIHMAAFDKEEITKQMKLAGEIFHKQELQRLANQETTMERLSKIRITPEAATRVIKADEESRKAMEELWEQDRRIIEARQKLDELNGDCTTCGCIPGANSCVMCSTNGDVDH